MNERVSTPLLIACWVTVASLGLTPRHLVAATPQVEALKLDAVIDVDLESVRGFAPAGGNPPDGHHLVDEIEGLAGIERLTAGIRVPDCDPQSLPGITNSDLYFVRLVFDRTLSPDDFGEIEIERTERSGERYVLYPRPGNNTGWMSSIAGGAETVIEISANSAEIKHRSFLGRSIDDVLSDDLAARWSKISNDADLRFAFSTPARSRIRPIGDIDANRLSPTADAMLEDWSVLSLVQSASLEVELGGDPLVRLEVEAASDAAAEFLDVWLVHRLAIAASFVDLASVQGLAAAPLGEIAADWKSAWKVERQGLLLGLLINRPPRFDEIAMAIRLAILPDYIPPGRAIEVGVTCEAGLDRSNGLLFVKGESSNLPAGTRLRISVTPVTKYAFDGDRGPTTIESVCVIAGDGTFHVCLAPGVPFKTGQYQLTVSSTGLSQPVEFNRTFGPSGTLMTGEVVTYVASESRSFIRTGMIETFRAGLTDVEITRMKQQALLLIAELSDLKAAMDQKINRRFFRIAERTRQRFLEDCKSRLAEIERGVHENIFDQTATMKFAGIENMMRMIVRSLENPASDSSGEIDVEGLVRSLENTVESIERNLESLEDYIENF